MSPLLVALCYGSALVLALALLWHFGAKHWYWHVLSVALALAIGLTPIPEPWNTVSITLAIGWAFFFLATWGLAAPFFAPKLRVLSHH